MNSPVPIVLLTDYGDRDPYAGILRGVISGIAPGHPVIDLTHEIQPGDVLRGAVSLWMSRSYFPTGTVFCCVVDPGVGTERRALLLDSGGKRFVGPDNGLFSFVIEAGSTAWALEAAEFQLSVVSSTFHGRDVFAPAAAYAALEVQGSSFGSPVGDLVRLVQPRLIMTQENAIEGEILYADRFGNLLTSLGVFQPNAVGDYILIPWLKDALPFATENRYSQEVAKVVLPGGHILDWVSTFADKPAGEPAVLVGSSGLLEVVANQSSAAHLLGLNRGDRLLLLQNGDK